MNANGALSGEFAFGGADRQAELLRAEGVEVIDGVVDLGRYGTTTSGFVDNLSTNLTRRAIRG